MIISPKIKPKIIHTNKIKNIIISKSLFKIILIIINPFTKKASIYLKPITIITPPLPNLLLIIIIIPNISSKTYPNNKVRTQFKLLSYTS